MPRRIAGARSAKQFGINAQCERRSAKQFGNNAQCEWRSAKQFGNNAQFIWRLAPSFKFCYYNMMCCDEFRANAIRRGA